MNMANCNIQPLGCDTIMVLRTKVDIQKARGVWMCVCVCALVLAGGLWYIKQLLGKQIYNCCIVMYAIAKF
jgi:hypothetical protein